MPITFYTTCAASPAARAVETVIRILKLDVKRRELDLIKNENLEPWFEKFNPASQVPVLDDNGYILTDSHAINSYLLTTYAPKDVLEQYYPTDPKERGIVDSRLHFENGTLFARMKTIILVIPKTKADLRAPTTESCGIGDARVASSVKPAFVQSIANLKEMYPRLQILGATETGIITLPLMLRGVKDIPLEKTQNLAEGVDYFEKLLEGKEWLAVNRLTVADISTIATIDLIELLIPLKHYKNISAWTARVRKACPFYEEIGRDQLNNFIAAFNETPYDIDDRWNKIQSFVKK